LRILRSILTSIRTATGIEPAAWRALNEVQALPAYCVAVEALVLVGERVRQDRDDAGAVFG
jgi:hypothetical protein